jgi:hypothetical protein
MNKEIKARWVAALRSGKYQQGRHWLCNRNTYCCLGVLCELAVEAGVALAESDKGLTRYKGHSDAEFEAKYPSKGIQDWVGITVMEPLVAAAGRKSIGLGELNDSGYFSFHEIADLIEAQL